MIPMQEAGEPFFVKSTKKLISTLRVYESTIHSVTQSHPCGMSTELEFEFEF